MTDSIELESLLGAGGMGQIWIGEHLLLHRRVAVKFLSEPLTDSLEALHRFGLEAQTIARLPSPHVPQVFDCGYMPDGTPFIVMELLEGVDLQYRLEVGDLLSVDEAGQLVAQVGSVLSAAHALGIVHRDIKPDNIFMVPGESGFTAKVLDFGIAKSTSEPRVTQTGITMGTPSYMSPEQLIGSKEIDGRSDLWSLAVVVYACLTGTLPFPGDTFGAVCIAVQTGAFVQPSSRREGLPRGLDAWFRRAFSRSPRDRFASADEMVAAFSEAAIHADPTATSTSGEVDRPYRQEPPRAAAERTEGPLALPLVRRRRSPARRGPGLVAALLVVSSAMVFLLGGDSVAALRQPMARVEAGVARLTATGRTLTETLAADLSAVASPGATDPTPVSPAPVSADGWLSAERVDEGRGRPRHKSPTTARPEAQP
ncbi:MAG: serine/threonine-protein kinase [Polyangiaceae bacterium]